MNTVAKFLHSTSAFFDRMARARVQSTLLGMGRDWVESHGYNWESLRAGIDHWPWRRDPAALAEEREIRRAIRDLNEFSDRELQDIGIGRRNIERAVRQGVAECGHDRPAQKRVA